MSRDSLAGVPRGPRIGIPDAPDALPGKDGLLQDGWTLCSQPAPDLTGTVVPTSVLMVGQSAQGGLALGDYARAGGRAGDRRAVPAAARLPAPDQQAGPAGRRAGAAGDAGRAGEPRGDRVDSRRPADRADPGGADGSAGAGRCGRTSARGSCSRCRRHAGVQYYLAEVGQLRPITELQYDIQRAYQATAVGVPEPGAACAADGADRGQRCAAGRSRRPSRAIRRRCGRTSYVPRTRRRCV